MTIEHWKLIAEVAKITIWPLAILCLAFYFRKDLRALVPRLRKAGLSGVEFDDSSQKAGTSGTKQIPSVEELGQLEKPDTSSLELVEIPG